MPRATTMWEELIRRGRVTGEQAELAMEEHRRTGEGVERALVRMGMLGGEELAQEQAGWYRLALVDLEGVSVSAEVLRLVPAAMAYRRRCVPIGMAGGRLRVATSDPSDLVGLEELSVAAGCGVDVVVAADEQVGAFLREHYGVGGDSLDAMRGGGVDGLAVEAGLEAGLDEAEAAQEASVIKLVNDLIGEAVEDRATDIHVEPYERELVVRYRIDGVLQRASVPASIHRFGAAIVSRIKIMASLDIAEKRRPQDGRISFRRRVSGTGRVQEFDLRVSVIPMLFGEGVVLRVLSKTAAAMSLDELGMPGGVLSRWDRLIGKPHGILLVTGPTGSGKSTTLYASLGRIVTEKIKAVTIEDPVEYHVSGVNQIQVNVKTGLTFAAGLRSVLRHDPDVVMVGEIRDRETAEVAIQASLTGHLVFSTLHTNDAAGAAPRLIDMGVEPFLVASSLEGVLAQRLVRRVCAACGRGREADAGEVPEGFPKERRLVEAVGCKACRQTGYRGRLGVFELLVMSGEVRELVMQRGSGPGLSARARELGDLWVLREDAYAKAAAGLTTVEEVTRALSV